MISKVQAEAVPALEGAVAGLPAKRLDMSHADEHRAAGVRIDEIDTGLLHAPSAPGPEEPHASPAVLRPADGARLRSIREILLTGDEAWHATVRGNEERQRRFALARPPGEKRPSIGRERGRRPVTDPRSGRLIADRARNLLPRAVTPQALDRCAGGQATVLGGRGNTAPAKAGRADQAASGPLSARGLRSCGSTAATRNEYRHQQEWEHRSHTGILPNRCNRSVTAQRSALSAAESDCLFFSTPAKRSPCFSTLPRTDSIVNAAGSRFSFTSFQRRGVETGAPSFGRTE